MDDISRELPAIQDTARNVTTVLEALPEIASNASVLPDLNIKVAAMYDELLPAIRAMQVTTCVSPLLAKSFLAFLFYPTKPVA